MFCEVKGAREGTQGSVSNPGGMADRTAPDTRRQALLDAAEARQYLGGISPQTLYRLVSDGLPLVKVRRRTFFRLRDLDDLIERSVRPREGGHGARRE